MMMKPKSTVYNTRAILYRRFTDIDTNYSLKTVYRTGTDPYKYWLFDEEKMDFIGLSDYPVGSTIVNAQGKALKYGGEYFVYSGGSWVKNSTTALETLAARFANIGKIQTNRYYRSGTFDYMVKGSVDGTTTQIVKGNIVPLTSFTIKHFNDYIHLSPDDLVVIGKRLYSVENPTYDMKMQPRPFYVYFATLNSIL